MLNCTVAQKRRQRGKKGSWKTGVVDTNKGDKINKQGNISIQVFIIKWSSTWPDSSIDCGSLTLAQLFSAAAKAAGERAGERNQYNAFGDGSCGGR